VFVFLENALIYVFGYHMLTKSKTRVPPFCWGRTVILKRQYFTASCKFNHRLNFLEITEIGNLPAYPLLFCCSSRPFFAFISLHCAQQPYRKPLLLTTIKVMVASFLQETIKLWGKNKGAWKSWKCRALLL
jgi:glucose-6-phosphate-specific signal transduction histidine kinase